MSLMFLKKLYNSDFELIFTFCIRKLTFPFTPHLDLLCERHGYW